MRSLKINAKHCKQRESGFSLIEMLIVVAIGIIATAITFVSMVPVMQQQRVNNAYNTTLAAMRQARDNAVSQRTSYAVTFATSATSNTITVAPALPSSVTGFQGDQSSVVYKLPTDVSFLAQSALASAAAPDGFGNGTAAIDFGYTANGGSGGQTVVYFCPDGSSQDATGGVGLCSGIWNGGVVYIARQGDVLSSRAVTLWGGTGRIHGWRLYAASGGGYQWLRQ